MNKIIKIGERKYKELCNYRLKTWKEDYYYPDYLGTWSLTSNRLTNITKPPKDKPHYRYKLIKLEKPEYQEFLTI